MAEQDTSSGALGRPLPLFDPAPSDSASAAQQVDLDSDDDDGGGSGGRRHISASVSKTSFTANTPANQKKAIQRLQQSLNFSDDSSHSSAASTPQKSAPIRLGQGSTHSLQGSTHSAPPTFSTPHRGVPAASEESGGEEEEGSGYVSDGEATNSGISITAIMSKLDQVKNYLREAEALHQHMKERLSEPGMAVQMNKMGRLVEDLRRQESGYLGILVRLLDGVPGTQAKATETEEGGGRSDEGTESLSEGEMVDKVNDDKVEKKEKKKEEEEEEGDERGNDSMSLKAELLKEKIEGQRAEKERQEEEMRMLRHQRDLLRKMVEQQKQIEALEARHRSLLLQQDSVEEDVDDQPTRARAAQTQQQTGGEGEEDEEEEEVESHGERQQSHEAVSEATNDQATELALAMKLQQLRERQARVQQLTTLIHQLQTENEKDNQSTVSTGVVAGRVSQPQVEEGSNEVVAVGSQAPPPELLELQRKLREAQEARAKLSRLQQMLTLLHETEVGEGVQSHAVINKPAPVVIQPVTDDEEEEEEEEDEEDEEVVGEEEEEEEEGEEGETGEKLAESENLEASVLSDYEERLMRRKREVMELQEQRDRLLATQRKLQHLQQTINHSESPPPLSVRNPPHRPPPPSAPTNTDGESEVLSPEELAQEMGKQRRLYNELLDKTQQIQSMVDEVTGARDMSGATWGGSSSEEDEDEEEGSIVTGLDETLEHTYTDGSSAVAVVENEGTMVEPSRQPLGTGRERNDSEQGGGKESVVFRVTRHTPGRLLRGQSPDVTLQSAKKRMKIDDDSGRPVDGGWPGVALPPSTHRTHTSSREETTQTGGVSAGHPTVTESHISFLHHQLAATSAMANQLVAGQQSLVGSVCRQLEALQLADRVNDHFASLHHYQAQLEHQYHQIQSAFVKLEQAAEDQPQQDVDEEEEEEEEGERHPEDPIYPDPPPPPHIPFSSATLSTANPGLPHSNNDRRHPSDGDSERRRELNPTVGWEVPNLSSHPPMSEPYRLSANRMPPAPGAYLPHIYQGSTGPRPPTAPIPREGGGEGLERNDPGMDSCPPPPLFRPYFHPPSFHPPPLPPHHFSPWIPPTPYNYPPLQSPGYSVGSAVHPHPPPSFYPNPNLSFPPPHNSGASPMYPPHHGYPSYDNSFRLNSSSGPNSFRGYPLYPPFGAPLRGGRGESRGGQRPFSPSGVTGISMQVQPPCSPPSAPSISNLPLSSSTSLQPGQNTGSGVELSDVTLQQHQAQGSSHSTSEPVKQTSLESSLFKPSSTLASHRPLTWTGTREGGGLRGERKKASNVPTVEKDQVVSLSVGLPNLTSKKGLGGEGGGDSGERPPEDFSVFDALRDTIYSEVATLIANNENRPHFLVELFRELQMLSTDYLRQRALYTLQDLVTRYLTEESVHRDRTRRKRMGELTAELRASWSEQTPSESLVTSDDELAARSGHTTEGEGERRDEEEEVEGQKPRDEEDPSFSSETMDTTVLRLDKAIARLRGSSGARPGEKMQPPIVSPGPLVSDLSQSTHLKHADLNTEAVHEQIKATMAEVIPVLKEHMNKACSQELLQRIRESVVSHTLTKLGEQSSAVEGFSNQLETALVSSLQKYLNQTLRECGEALLVEVSEVLFNELVFFNLIQTMGVQREPELGTLSAARGSGVEERGEKEKKEGVDRIQSHTLPVLQTLTAAVERSINDEQEALGKERDDELAKEWNGVQDRPSSPSLDGDQTVLAESSTIESRSMEGGGKKEQTGVNTETTPNGEREETPPTPVVISAVSSTGADSDIQSPPPLPSIDQLTVQTKMAVEQKSTDGIAGILASMEQEPELAGASDEIPQPIPNPSKALAEP